MYVNEVLGRHLHVMTPGATQGGQTWHVQTLGGQIFTMGAKYKQVYPGSPCHKLHDSEVVIFNISTFLFLHAFIYIYHRSLTVTNPARTNPGQNKSPPDSFDGVRST